MKYAVVFLAVCAGLCAVALAAPDEKAFMLFESGAYEGAATTAAAVGGAENLALAARALNAKAYLETDEDDARKTAKRAFKFAEAAVDADPDLVEGYLQGAISLGQRGSRTAAWKGFFLGLAPRARDRLDAALAIEPENAWALSSSAAWHLEVARRGGAGMYGADPEEGHRQFMAARVAAPDNLPIAYECALRLIAYGREDWRGDARAALAAALALTPHDAFERGVQARARSLEAAVAAGRDAEQAFIDAQP